MDGAGNRILFEHTTPPAWTRPALTDPMGPGIFFRQDLKLPAGSMAARLQVMPLPAVPDGTVITARLAARDGRLVAEGRWTCSRAAPEAADWLMLRFALAAPADLVLACDASARADAVFLRSCKVMEARPGIPEDWATTHAQLDRWPLDRLRSVMIGNSGVCTASCIHCPTNKPWLAGPKPGVMPDRIFDRLLDGLVACGLPVTGAIGFGLFADPLTDRKLAERIRRVKAALPGVAVTISTTGAAYAPRQAEAIGLADSIGVHIESIDPATYDRLMAPLRLTDVRPRIEALVAAAGPKAHLAVPVHRASAPGLGELGAWWRGLGGGGVLPQPFTNRRITTPEVLGLHFGPITGACTQDLAYDLLVDWDGRLVTCCNDFGREAPLGSLAEQDLPALLADERRRLLFQRLRHRAWQSIGICRDCLFDNSEALAAAAAPLQG